MGILVGIDRTGRFVGVFGRACLRRAGGEQVQLFFGLIWLTGALALFAYEFATGETRFTIRGLNVSAGWLLVLLSAWNFVRWYSTRAHRAEQETLRRVHEARLRQARQRERPTEPNPDFDFRDPSP